MFFAIKKLAQGLEFAASAPPATDLGIQGFSHLRGQGKHIKDNVCLIFTENAINQLGFLLLIIAVNHLGVAACYGQHGGKKYY